MPLAISPWAPSTDDDDDDASARPATCRRRLPACNAGPYVWTRSSAGSDSAEASAYIVRCAAACALTNANTQGTCPAEPGRTCLRTNLQCLPLSIHPLYIPEHMLHVSMCMHLCHSTPPSQHQDRQPRAQSRKRAAVGGLSRRMTSVAQQWMPGTLEPCLQLSTVCATVPSPPSAPQPLFHLLHLGLQETEGSEESRVETALLLAALHTDVAFKQRWRPPLSTDRPEAARQVPHTRPPVGGTCRPLRGGSQRQGTGYLSASTSTILRRLAFSFFLLLPSFVSDRRPPDARRRRFGLPLVSARQVSGPASPVCSHFPSSRLRVLLSVSALCSLAESQRAPNGWTAQPQLTGCLRLADGTDGGAGALVFEILFETGLRCGPVGPAPEAGRGTFRAGQARQSARAYGLVQAGLGAGSRAVAREPTSISLAIGPVEMADGL
ncbi:hypothetical protein CDD83_3925 [Cordyceps sp. RAO-2017]|nr:hypothetical protein CDD83_3925 [Cordyceps sp. RAO-2017]